MPYFIEDALSRLSVLTESNPLSAFIVSLPLTIPTTLELLFDLSTL